MTRLVSFFQRFATLRNALIALVLFGINTLALQFLDQPLMGLAGGEPKLDLRFGYSPETVQTLFTAYGDEGRAIYLWNLAVDTPFPVIGAVAMILFTLIAFRSHFWQKILILPPVVFAITDLIENALLASLAVSFPSLPTNLIVVASLITQVKRAAYYASALILIVSILLVAAAEVRKRIRPTGSVA